jgi:DNA-binding transcriptional ArsR family regulator
MRKFAPIKIIDEGTAEIIVHPVRFRILQFVKAASEPPFVEQIAEAVHEHPRLVSHHLNVLQEIGLVDCRYEVAKAKGSMTRGVAIRVCAPTPKLSQVLEEIERAMAEVK